MEILNFLSSTLLLVVFFPLLGAVVLLFINREQKRSHSLAGGCVFARHLCAVAGDAGAV